MAIYEKVDDLLIDLAGDVFEDGVDLNRDMKAEGLYLDRCAPANLGEDATPISDFTEHFTAQVAMEGIKDDLDLIDHALALVWGVPSQSMARMI